MKGLLALVGVVLFLGAISAVVVAWSISPGAGYPLGASGSAAGAGGSPSIEPVPACNIDFLGVTVGTTSKPTTSRMDNIEMAEGEDMVLWVTAFPFKGDDLCQTSISVQAADISVAPSTVYAYVDSKQGESRTYTFLMTPAKAGKHLYTVTANNNSWLFDVTVNTWMGISPGVARIFTGLGAVFGPMLTVPWWLDRRRERKEASSGEESSQGDL